MIDEIEVFNPVRIIEQSELNDQQKQLVSQLVAKTKGISSGKAVLWAKDIESLGKSHRVALGSGNTRTMKPVVLHGKQGYCVIAPQYLPHFQGVGTTVTKGQTATSIDELFD